MRNPVDRLTEGLPRGWRVTIDWLVTIVGAIAIVLAIKAWVVNPYRIPSSSMEPTLHCARPDSGCEARFSDRVLACRFCYHFWSPRRGDIVVFKTPPLAAIRCGEGGTFVKRLIGLPGETISEKTGYVYINGKKLNEPYIQSSRRDTRTIAPEKIPKGHYFMMGDNRASSCDSRSWGTVPRKDLIGNVFATYWPPNRLIDPVGAAPGATIARGFRAVLPMSTTIQDIERRQLREVPQFKAGDTVRVHFRVIEGTRQRIQVFEGLVIKRQGAGARETFTVRKNSFGVGVERTFPLHSPKIDKIEVGAIGDVNRAKLYYLRGKVGKKARVRELRSS